MDFETKIRDKQTTAIEFSVIMKFVNVKEPGICHGRSFYYNMTHKEDPTKDLDGSVPMRIFVEKFMQLHEQNAKQEGLKEYAIKIIELEDFSNSLVKSSLEDAFCLTWVVYQILAFIVRIPNYFYKDKNPALLLIRKCAVLATVADPKGSAANDNNKSS